MTKNSEFPEQKGLDAPLVSGSFISKDEYLNAISIIKAYQKQFEMRLKEITDTNNEILDFRTEKIMLSDYISNHFGYDNNKFISQRVFNALKLNNELLGITKNPTIFELSMVSEEKLKKAKWINSKGIINIHRFLKSKGMSLLP